MVKVTSPNIVRFIRASLKLGYECGKSFWILGTQHIGLIIVTFGFCFFASLLLIGRLQKPSTTNTIGTPIASWIENFTPAKIGSVYQRAAKPINDQHMISERRSKSANITQFAFEPTWSQDGYFLAFLTVEEVKYTDIHVAYPDGLVERITYTPDVEYTLAWSPDAKYIAYTRGSPGSLFLPQVWVIHVQQGDTMQVAFQSDGECLTWVDEETVAFREAPNGPARQVNLNKPGLVLPFEGPELCGLSVQDYTAGNQPPWKLKWQTEPLHSPRMSDWVKVSGSPVE